MQSSSQQCNESCKRTRTRRGRKQRERNLLQSCKKEGMLFGNLDPVPYDRNVDAPPGACLNCRSFRHKHKDCMNPKIHEYCCNCGRREVTVEECPRCARAFHAQDHVMKIWMYETFFDEESGCEKQMLEKKEDRRNESNFHGPSDDGWGELAASRGKMSELKSHDSSETVYTDTYDRESMENLNESRMYSVDENPNQSKKKEGPSTVDPLRDWLRFFDAIKHLPVEAQNVVAVQFAAEKKKMMDEKEARLGSATKMS